MSAFADNVLKQAYADIRESNGALRFGQAVFNRAVAWDRSGSAESLRGTPLDPFYRDERAIDFLEEVERLRNGGAA